jgi:ubiquinone/menaquinone biosynthesis C-methylase UbiE
MCEALAMTTGTGEAVRSWWEDSWKGATDARDEEYRYRMEPFIHSVAQFTRHHGRELLEIGVGSGIDHLQWARAGAHCHGIDITAEAIEQTSARLAAEGLTSDLRLGDAEVLPFPDASFDVVYSWGVIHHADHPQRVIGEVHRVLRPGGRFIGMLYERHSAVAAKLWVKHALLRFRPRMSLAEVLALHMESPGTKAYTVQELRATFEHFRTSEFQHLVTPYDKSHMPRIVGSMMPDRFGWFIAIRAQK